MQDDGTDRARKIERLVACFEAGDLAVAEDIARQLAAADREDEEALHLLAQIVFKEKRALEALDLMEDLLSLAPMRASRHNDYGVMLASLGRWADAEAAYRLSLALDPAGVDARYNLALALFRQKRNDEALAVLEPLERQAPEFAGQYALRGEILQDEKRPAEAVLAFSKAVELGLDDAGVLRRLGMALSDAGNKDEAFAMLARSGVLDPENAAVNFYLGNLFREQGKLDEAAAHYRKAIAKSPEFAEAHNNLGLALQAMGETRAAEEAFARGISASPGLSALHNNLGNNQLRLGRMDLALACFRKAVDLSPDSFEAWNNLGETYHRLQRLDEAEECYRRSLSIVPDNACAELNLGILLLLRGDLPAGWPYYEKRWEMPNIKEKRPRFRQPEWRGEDLEGRTLLIYVEQGMGDNIQFVRYLPLLRQRYPSARIYYWGLKPLMRLFADLAARCQVELLPETIHGGVPPIDCHIALLTLPERLGTTLGTIPAQAPLAPPAGLAEKWAPRLAGLAGRKVGLVWAGGETYQFHQFRAMRLKQLRPLLEAPGISWVSLQKGPGAGEIAAEGLSGSILDLMDEVEDFADTAAIIAHLDLVISVDTSVLHLAGAMGKPVWLLNRFDTDWRWLLERADSPWYPTMRIFRQTSFGDWDSAVTPAARALADWTGGNDGPGDARPAAILEQIFGDGHLNYRVVRARHGWMLANPKDFYIGRALLEYGEYSEIEAEFFRRCRFKPGRIVEVGANIGSHTVRLAKAAAARGETMEVFEPQPLVFQNLCANLALNGLRNVRAWPFACGGETETLSFAEPDYDAPGNFGGVTMSRAKAGPGRISVPCVRLDDVLGEEAVALIKVDVEGFELAALRGAGRILEHSRPVLYVENDRPAGSKDLIEWLWSRGYRLFWHTPLLFNPHNFFGKPDNLFGAVGSLNMFCVPTECQVEVPGLDEIVDSSKYPLAK